MKSGSTVFERNNKGQQLTSHMMCRFRESVPNWAKVKYNHFLIIRFDCLTTFLVFENLAKWHLYLLHSSPSRSRSVAKCYHLCRSGYHLRNLVSPAQEPRTS